MFDNLDLNRLYEIPTMLRPVLRDSEEYIALRDSIKLRGVMNPILVTPRDDKYLVVDGNYRVAACRDLKLEGIPAIVRILTDAEIAEAQLITSHHTVQTKPSQYSLALIRILASNPNLTIKVLAAKIGKSTNFIRQRLKLDNLIHVAMDQVDEGQITLSNGYILAKLPKSEQVNWLQRASIDSAGKFATEVLARVREIKNGIKMVR